MLTLYFLVLRISDMLLYVVRILFALLVRLRFSLATGFLVRHFENGRNFLIYSRIKYLMHATKVSWAVRKGRTPLVFVVVFCATCCRSFCNVVMDWLETSIDIYSVRFVVRLLWILYELYASRLLLNKSATTTVYASQHVVAGHIYLLTFAAYVHCIMFKYSCPQTVYYILLLELKLIRLIHRIVLINL